ncbi:hypothetical protein DFH27DRAFT_546707 [Peziza echinospora]|nr:hypothetical protein DFH27DRAFT_546707 [Peziza echinospora]
MGRESRWGVKYRVPCLYIGLLAVFIPGWRSRGSPKAMLVNVAMGLGIGSIHLTGHVYGIGRVEWIPARCGAV